jgi:2-methylaconitate isomerase
MRQPSGALAVGAKATQQNGAWSVTKAVMCRRARRMTES